MASGGQEVRGWWSGKASVEVIELWEGAWQQWEQQVQRPCAQRSMSSLGTERAKPVPSSEACRWSAWRPAVADLSEGQVECRGTHWAHAPCVRVWCPRRPLSWCVGLGGIQGAVLRRGQPLAWLGFPSHWRFWWVRICVCVCSFLSVFMCQLGSLVPTWPPPQPPVWVSGWDSG